jgi:hypothetical protein
MKRRSLIISLVLAMLLTATLVTPALAAKPVPFAAAGTITYITPGDVFPAGNSGRFVVAERELGGSIAGSINGDFTLTYKANVELATQAGALHGTLVAGGYEFKVNGQIEPLTFYGWYVLDVIPLYQLDISGKWSAKGSQGNGDFFATIVFIPTPDGHVYAIVDSYFEMTGKWGG